MILTKKISILCFFIVIGFTLSFIVYYYIFPLILADFHPDNNQGPVIINQLNYGNNINVKDKSNNNNNLAVSLYAQGLSFPTSMAFVDNNTIMVLEKNTGNVRLVSHGKLQREPIFKVSNIDNNAERGLLGIAVLKENDYNNSNTDKIQNKFSNIQKTDYKHTETLPSKSNSRYSIFLYYTEKTKDTFNNNNSSSNASIYNDNQVIRNRIYIYSWDGDYSHKLDKPILLMDLPATLGPYHNGGKLKIGPDNNLYGVIGDLSTINNTLQNRPDYGSKDNFSNTVPNNSSVIVRIDPKNGSYLEDNPFFKYYNNNTTLKSLDYYYAYGIRNSFGLSFDPITGNLWDTENGEDKYDEINLVTSGFNSGWHKVMGPLSRNNGSSESDLIMFKGSHYADPVFSWAIPIGITDIEFFNSSKFGHKYNNNIFVADINENNLYFFKVNSSRSGIELDKPIKSIEHDTLDDKVVDNKIESEQVLIAKGFDGKITDIETGSDGYLYILTYFDGRIYKISS